MYLPDIRAKDSEHQTIQSNDASIPVRRPASARAGVTEVHGSFSHRSVQSRDDWICTSSLSVPAGLEMGGLGGLSHLLGNFDKYTSRSITGTRLRTVRPCST